jgi:hypothetical protein
MATMTVAPSPSQLLPADEELIKRCSTKLLDVVPPLSEAMSVHLHKQVPDLGGVDEEEPLEQTRRSCEVVMAEMFVMLRAGLPSSAHETPSDALEYVRYMKGRGVGLKPVLRAYFLGLAMFQPIVRAEFERSAPDNATLLRALEYVQTYVFVFIDTVTERIAGEYGTARQDWMAPPDDPVWQDPASIEAAARFTADYKANPREVISARQQAEAALDRFCGHFETAREDDRIGRRLAQAQTTVQVDLADEPDLCVTLLLDRSPIEILNGEHASEVEMTLSSVDLDRMWSRDFHLPMAIARGRVGVRGPVRKFLRVMPIVRTLAPGGKPPFSKAADPNEL